MTTRRQSYDHKDLVSVADAGSLGKGIFAKEDIEKGVNVFTWDGHMRVGSCSWYEGYRWLQTGQDEWIDPFPWNPGYYINHSCNPNCGIKCSRNTVAMRDIKKGEQITIDYSTTEREVGWFMICSCREKDCRRVIKSYEFLPTELKHKYRDFTSEYLK